MAAEVADLLLITRRMNGVERAFTNRIKELLERFKESGLSAYEREELRFLWDTLRPTLINVRESYNDFVKKLAQGKKDET